MIINTRTLSRILFKSNRLTGGSWVSLSTASIKGGGLSSSWYTFWVALTSVSITGTPKVGETLTASYEPTTASPTSFVWYRDDVAISGATSQTYVVTSSDVGHYLKVRAYASDTYVESTSVLAEITSGTMSGTYIYGRSATYTVSPSGVAYTYQWYRGNTPISGATSTTYTYVPEDVGYVLKCVATKGGATITGSTGAIRIASLSVSGTPLVGQTLTANVNPSTTYTYQWYRGDTPISGANAQTYTLVSADNGYTIKVKATRGLVSYESSPTSAVQMYVHKTGTLASWEGYLGRFQDPKTTVVLAIPSGKYVDAITMVGTAHNYDSTISYVARATINYPTAATVISQGFRLDPNQSQSFNLSKEGLFSTYGTQAQTQVSFYVGESGNTNGLRNQTNQDKWVFKITSWYEVG